MKKPKTPPPVRANRIERILAIAVVVVIVASLGCFIAMIVGTSLGVGDNDGFSHGIWPTIILVPYYGLPLAFVLIVALLASNGVRRSRAAKRGER